MLTILNLVYDSTNRSTRNDIPLTRKETQFSIVGQC